MFVGWNMNTNLITISPETSVFKAREMMDHHRISHLPVTDGKAHLLGIVTDRDLRQAWASPATTLSVHELTYVLQKLTVESIMTKKVVTATPDMTIERAARVLRDHKIGCLPVLKNGKLVGMITSTDLMDVFLKALGLSEDTKRFSILVRDRIGIVAEVGKQMQEASINIRSILVVPLRGHENVWQLMVRVNLDDFQKATESLQASGFKIVADYVEELTPFLPD